MRSKTGFLLASLVLLTMFLMYPGKTVSCSAYSVMFFTFGTAGLLAAGACLFEIQTLWNTFGKMPKIVSASLGFFTLVQLWHALTNGANYSAENTAYMFAFVFIPVFGCVFADALLKLMPYFLAVLWIPNIILSSVEMLKYKTLPFGLPQNVNWNAALMIITSAAALFVIFKHAKRGTAIAVSIPLLCAAGYPFIKCDSRGAIISFCAAAVLILILHTPERRRKAVYSAIACAAVLAVILAFTLFRSEFSYFAHDDERPFFAKSAVAMIFDSPIAGCGSPSFEQEYLKYRSADYFRLRNCAVRTEHPHNDVLYVAATSGIAGLAAYLIFMLAGVFVFLFRYRSCMAPEKKLLFFMYVLLLIHAQVDLVLYRVPTSLAAYLCAGIFLRETCSTENEKDARLPVSATITARAAGIVAMTVALALACVNLYSWHLHYNLASLKRAGASDETVSRAAMKSLSFTNGNPELEYSALFTLVATSHADSYAIDAALKRRGATPDYAHKNMFIAELLSRNGNPDAAEKFLMREIELYPLTTIPLRKLMTLYHNSGRTDAADKVAERLIQVTEIQKIDIARGELDLIYDNPYYDLRPWELKKIKKAESRPMK